MTKTILITGSTDGIGLAAARELVARGQRVLLHGRDPMKLESAHDRIAAEVRAEGVAGSYTADLSDLGAVERLARHVAEEHPELDVLINNAGVFRTAHPRTPEGRDVRFVVNVLAPFVLGRALALTLGAGGRIVNLSSAAQARVDLGALRGEVQLDDQQAYAQSKLALTMWTRAFAAERGDEGPMAVAVNPGSLLATKMVRDAYGIAGSDVSTGAELLCRAALSEDFGDAAGQYFDGDAGRFAPPHADALDDALVEEVVRAIEVLAG